MVDSCLTRPDSQCGECPISEKLKCRFKLRHLAFFYLLFMAYFIPAMIGVFKAGYQLYLLGWALIGIVFFLFWEIRILCSHCPYYAEKGLTLHCIANYGSPRLWRYRPEPISYSEKIQLAIGFSLMLGYPFPFLILSEQFILFLLTAVGLMVFFLTLQKYTCSKCVNFSCLLNHVPKEVIDEYLKRNPVMRKAWEEYGWQIAS